VNDLTESEKQDLISEIHSAREDVSNVSQILLDLEAELGEIESALATLPSILESLRYRGYIFLRYLDRSIDSLSSSWRDVSPPIREAVRSMKYSFQPNAESLQAEMDRVDSEIDRSSESVSSGYEQVVESLSSRAESLESHARQDAEHVSGALRNFKEALSSIQRDISIAENTLQLTSQASFRLREGENPLLALRAKYLLGEKNEGSLFLTDQRFSFEGERDVVLEKLWILPTKKRKERFVVAEAPIGAIAEIAKGRVGLLEWTGVYVRFKPETGWAEMPFDVKGEEANTIVRFFNYLSGGDADLDKTDLQGTAAQKRISTPTIVRCGYCGAPYSREIYRGQISLKCEYCGSSIALG